MSDDFIYDQEESSAASGGRSPFVMAVAILGTIFVLAAICSAVFWFTRDGNGGTPTNQAEIAAIETQNAIVAVTNEAVTATIAAMETEAALPTATATTPPTFTPQPSVTPIPSETPVVQSADGSPTPNILATDIALSGGVDANGNTPTPIPGFASGGSGNGTSSTGGGALPQTGIDTWSALIAAVVLIVVLVGARRLRS